MNALVPTGPAGQVALSSLLAQAQPDATHTATLRGLRRRVWVPVAVVTAAIAAWCSWAPLSGAVVTAGLVQTELGRKVVQHQEGGIVREVLVRQGQTVRRGDPLVVVADVRNDAAFEILRKQRDGEQLRIERTRAELALQASVNWPTGTAAPGDTQLRERQLFETRRRALQDELAAMQSQQRDAQARVVALTAQLEASGRTAALAREELDINRPLAESGFIQKTRLLALERGVADLSSRVEAIRGEIAEARMQANAMGHAMAQARGVYQQRAADELKEATARVRELDDRLRASQDQVERQTVRAPVDGTVMALRVSASGTAVGPREPLLEIVPSRENLVVELRIDPHDIEHVRPGAEAEVRLSAFDARTTPLLPARVISVAPDAVTDANTQKSWYTAQVEVQAGELARHRELRLQAGMPAEVFVTTPPRSLLEYLLEPVGVFARRALREP
ncbi:HlyD family type I secretion periplasmic adaptor subunit [Caldimonas brevitalea]|uniref:Membrane fusion protein (MFP) family protein n=1 Tax=Caldimonas brevitalea TaxID=413882 RepID=A0A0G3BNG1_9BURK|nr:HlyD family type I secretion periplasmic adaptor subunit [Caldimonas brevitalea]AKJ28085.1 HlyD family secretion protein [Caldimonas brevitalea]